MSLRGPGDTRGRHASTTDKQFIGENEPPEVLRALLDRHVTQQIGVARLSRLALHAGLEDVLEAAVEVLRDGLQADSAKVLELVGEEFDFELRTDTGRMGQETGDDELRHARANPSTAVAKAIRHDRIVLVEDYDGQDELERSELLEQRDVRSSLVVRIPGTKQPFGVLGAQARAPENFSDNDFEFVHTVANLLGEFVERERSNEQRRRMYEELHNALTAREEMLAVISHDLRSPASAIKLSLEVVRRAVHDPDGPIKPELVERAIHKANSNIDRMMTLMDDLLAMSRTETDSFDIDWEDVDLREVVDDVLFDFEKALESSGSEIEVRGEESVVGHWDWVRLQQIVSNLVSNAIKYGEGNPITIELVTENQVTENQVTENQVAENQFAILRVSDQGRGIPQPQQERIFEQFVRIDHRDNEQLEDSYGMGLWIVKRIVSALHGSIDVDSLPDEGTTFTVRLPRSR